MNPNIAKYREWAAMHGNYTRSGDAKKTNHSHDELQKVLADLIAENADRLLFALFKDDDTSVQLWAAAHTLELDENRAINKLQDLSDLNVPLVSMSARYTIKGWKAGGLRVRK
ncbi:DUF2019 domain-containing protein [Shimia sediminis]|uniref:DUF2019 domain-containing protein n=1 Tax=Shimia sediminis TaxID=2497945 RepID=UPI000F8EB90A|nr:DUF2019 domain-containing protein [Shimia sediminis]